MSVEFPHSGLCLQVRNLLHKTTPRSRRVALIWGYLLLTNYRVCPPGNCRLFSIHPDFTQSSAGHSGHDILCGRRMGRLGVLET
jgi:hypothetical protein